MALQLGNWEPDTPDFGTNQVSDIDGCVPINGGYGPFPSMTALSQALPSACLGAVTVRRSASFYDLYAGTATRLYHFNTATNVFDDVSGPSAPYAVPDGDYWQFALFGNKLIAVNAQTKSQVINLTTPTAFADLASGSAPKARFVGVIGDFVVMGCITGAENSVQWSALNDETGWTVGINFSDVQVFPDGGAVRGIALSESGLIFQEDRVQLMSFVGTPYVFQFQVIAHNRSCRAPYSIVKAGQRTYVWFENGLKFYEQGIETSLGFGRVDQFLATNVFRSNASRVVGTADPVNSRIYWAYQSNNQSLTQFDKILVYDYLLDRFSKVSGAFSFILPALSAGVTLEGLDAYGTLDSLPYSLDSSAWGGGIPSLAGFTPAGVFGFFASSPLAVQIDTAEAQVSAPNRTLITAVTPICDAPTATVAVAIRERRIDPFVYGADQAIGVDGSTPQYASGRFHRARIKIPAAATWTSIVALDVQGTDDGER